MSGVPDGPAGAGLAAPPPLASRRFSFPRLFATGAARFRGLRLRGPRPAGWSVHSPPPGASAGDLILSPRLIPLPFRPSPCPFSFLLPPRFLLPPFPSAMLPSYPPCSLFSLLASLVIVFSVPSHPPPSFVPCPPLCLSPPPCVFFGCVSPSLPPLPSCLFCPPSPSSPSFPCFSAFPFPPVPTAFPVSLPSPSLPPVLPFPPVPSAFLVSLPSPSHPPSPK